MTELNHGNITSEAVIKRLQQAGVAITSQRVLIAREFFSCNAHWSAEQLLSRLRRDRAKVSKATIYNTLRMFVEHRLAREVIIDPSRVFYDSNPEPHHHFYDVTSGQLTDIPLGAVTLASVPALPEGVEMEGVDIVLRIRSRR